MEDKKFEIVLRSNYGSASERTTGLGEFDRRAEAVIKLTEMAESMRQSGHNIVVQTDLSGTHIEHVEGSYVRRWVVEEFIAGSDDRDLELSVREIHAML